MKQSLSRRSFVQLLSITALVPGLIKQAFATSWPADAFNAREVDVVMKSITGDQSTTESDKIHIKVPAIAENGAVVPVSVTTTLAGVQSIALLVSNNPGPLVSTFEFGDNIEPYVSTRVKMAETSDIVVVVKTDQGFYTAAKEVKVTIGGCGG